MKTDSATDFDSLAEEASLAVLNTAGDIEQTTDFQYAQRVNGGRQGAVSFTFKGGEILKP